MLRHGRLVTVGGHTSIGHPRGTDTLTPASSPARDPWRLLHLTVRLAAFRRSRASE